ncbi:DUF6083 domain-containing protein [Streptomyces goshikiensis]|uniref:DUF6083 domain-containing protein n=1 Tax=Streptomyces goshikiensis TaxID=1942 RepID=UPI00372116A8
MHARPCRHLVEYYDRDDGGRIPLVPHESIPLRSRWNVNGGVASVGAQGLAHCYIAHPAPCPGNDRGIRMPDSRCRPVPTYAAT